MSRHHKMQKGSFFSTSVGGLVLLALTAACNSPLAPSRNPTAPSQPPQPGQNWPGLAGTYTMALSASNRCAPDFPEAMRTRTYTASITQVGGSLNVTLEGRSSFPSFFPGWGDSFTGVFGETNDVIFWLDQIEEWLEQHLLFVSGRMTVTIVEEGLSGFLEGEMRLVGNQGFTCTAPDHSVKFSR